MYRYHIALFVHLLAVMAAFSATAVTKLAAGRRARAKTVADALDWHNVLASWSKVFPISLAILVLTGSYMLSLAHIGVWSNGFVVAGLTGAVWLFGSGAYLGKKGDALKKVLEQIASKNPDQPAPRRVPPRLVLTLPLINSGVALGVVFDMVTKPASVPVALGVLAIAAALSSAKQLRRRPSRAAQPARMSPASA
jgi:hypothetical protein